MPRLCSSLLLSLVVASSASAVTMDWTFVGNPGNAADADPDSNCAPGFAPCGAVGYAYNIGTYEVTNAQYTEFLNSKAKSDPYGLYSTLMANGTGGPLGPIIGGITRTGSSGSYSYATIAGRANKPVVFVSFYDAARFANWMNNGQASGDTETGTYILLGGTATPSNGTSVIRNAGATIVLPSENEWYKAAYYDSATASYFDYPTSSNTQTICAAPTATANRANCGGAAGDLTIKGSYTGSPGGAGGATSSDCGPENRSHVATPFA